MKTDSIIEHYVPSTLFTVFSPWEVALIITPIL